MIEKEEAWKVAEIAKRQAFLIKKHQEEYRKNKEALTRLRAQYHDIADAQALPERLEGSELGSRSMLNRFPFLDFFKTKQRESRGNKAEPSKAGSASFFNCDDLSEGEEVELDNCEL
jgi:hypothetical protein